MIPQEMTDAVLRSVLGFVLLLMLTRFIGKKAISQMTFFDFAVAITLGSVTANLAISYARSVYSITAILISFSLLTVLTDYLHLKNIRFSKLVESEPAVLISNGRINDKNMKKERLNIQNLTALLRDKNIYNIADVEFAIMENDGRLSVLPKSQKQPITPSDIKIETGYKGLTKDIILDGKVLLENLKDVNLNEEWLKNQLNAQGIQSIHEVFYAGLDTSGNLYVSTKSKTVEKHGKYGIE